MKTMKKRGILASILIVMMIMMTLAGCGTNGDATDNGDNGDNGAAVESVYPLTVTDSEGNEVTFDAAPQKVISVAPSLTETLFAIGAGDLVVGRTEYCNYPEEALAVATIGTFSNPNTELILDMEPNVIFSAGAVPEDAQAIFDTAGIKVIVVNPTTVDEIEECIALMGQILDMNEGAAQVNAGIEAERTAVKEALGDVAAKRVFVDIGYSYTPGDNTYMNAIIEDELGAINIASDTGDGFVMISEEVVVEKDPEVIIRNVDMGGDGDAPEISENLKGTTAYLEGGVVDVTSGGYDNDIMTRAGARVGEAIRFFAESIYPELFE